MYTFLRTSVFAFASAAVASLSFAGPFSGSFGGSANGRGGSLKGNVRSMVQQKMGQPGGSSSWKKPSSNGPGKQPDWKTRGDVFGTPNGPATGGTVGTPLKKPMKPKPGLGGQPSVAGNGPVAPVKVLTVNTLPTPNATPAAGQGRPGYVFENGAWRRAKAGEVSTGTAVIRDHRPAEAGVAGQSRPWNYEESNYGYKKPLGGSDVSGGVTVTDGPPRDLSNATHYGEGPGLHTIYNLFRPRGFSAPNGAARDHRDKK